MDKTGATMAGLAALCVITLGATVVYRMRVAHEQEVAAAADESDALAHRFTCQDLLDASRDSIMWTGGPTNPSRNEVYYIMDDYVPVFVHHYAPHSIWDTPTNVEQIKTVVAQMCQMTGDRSEPISHTITWVIDTMMPHQAEFPADESLPGDDQ
jgi:hypothetical protein